MRQFQKVYLAGPITGLSYDEARLGWRQEFPLKLLPHIQCFSPMRGKDHLKDLDCIAGNRDAYSSKALTSGSGITCRDRNDVKTCDVMVANFLGATKGSLGTAVEFGWADAWQKPVIMVIEKDDLAALNPHDHLMLNEIAGYIVDNLDEAAALVNLLLTPGV